jgi:uncharacterized protein YcnI
MAALRFVACLAVAFLVSGAGASAHIRVSPAEAAHGATVTLAFRVPNERTNASTTFVEVQFPQDHPIGSVTAEPAPGWTARVAMKDGAVDTITWSGGAIGPGQARTFAVRARLPATGDELYFRAVQSYSSGETVRWIQIRNPGEPEPPNPAPMLRLVG